MSDHFPNNRTDWRQLCDVIVIISTLVSGMAEQSANVVQRCEDAKGSKHLMLNECDLSKFPDAVFLLTKGLDLESVDLSRNMLKRVHTQLGTKFATITRECLIDILIRKPAIQSCTFPLLGLKQASIFRTINWKVYRTAFVAWSG